MSVDENKAVVRAYFAALDRKDIPAVGELFGSAYRLQFDGNPEMDRSAAIGMFGTFFGAFPDVRHEMLDILGEGDRVAARLIVHGTHNGDLMGMPPTGKTVAFASSNGVRLQNGKIVEHWAVTDLLGMMRQLGAEPAAHQ